jgi:excisionase family DNA binding protein
MAQIDDKPATAGNGETGRSPVPNDENERVEAEMSRRQSYTVDEAAVLLKVCRNTAYSAVKSGVIPSFKIGRVIRVPYDFQERMAQG